MKLEEFVKTFILPNTLIRLWYPTEGGHQQVLNDVLMEWDLLKSETYENYLNHEVIGVTDILTHDNYKEAVNIVILKLEDYPSLQDSVKVLITNLQRDEDYYRTWRDNLSMSYQDEYNLNPNLDVHTLVNNAADRFLKLLTY